MSSRDMHHQPALHEPVFAAALGIPPRAFFKLAYWLMTSLPGVKFLFFTGLLLLVISLLSWRFSPYTAFGFAIYAFIGTLVLPYMVAVPLQRTLISSRRLVLVPGFALASGLALLGMAVLMSTVLPLLARLYGIPAISSLLGIRIFVLASLYAGIVHFCLLSRHAPLLLSTLPFVLVVLLQTFSSWVGMLWGNTPFMLVLLLLCLGGWLQALWLLYRRNSFRAPVNRNGTMLMEQDTFQPQGNLWLPVRGDSAPENTLLHGYHASLSARSLYLLYSVGISPLVAAAAIHAVHLASDGGRITLGFMPLVLVFHLFLIATLPWAWAELAPRTRLLWLRSGAGRQTLWRLLEHHLQRNYLLMFCCTALFFLLAWLQNGSPSDHQLSYFVMMIATSVHVGYLSLMARLCCWPGWVQAVAMIVLILCVALLVWAGPRGMAALPVLLALTLYYRHICKRAFLTVDWIRLKPLGRTRKGPASV